MPGHMLHMTNVPTHTHTFTHTHTQTLPLKSLSEQKGRGSKTSHWKDPGSSQVLGQCPGKAGAGGGPWQMRGAGARPRLTAEVKAQEINFNTRALSPLPGDLLHKFIL